jgi:RNA polymerase sigma-70 factor (ECF subfamily)
MKTALSGTADCILMDRVKAGDESALNEIVQRHWDPIVSYSTRIVGTVDTAEEVAQETFVRLWQTRTRWAPGGSVRSFLFRTARNLGLGILRHFEVRRRAEPEVRQALTLDNPTPLEILAQKEMRTALWTAIDALPARRREALVLVRIQGLSLDEAAQRMALSRQTVANHISLALEDLEELLREVDD